MNRTRVAPGALKYLILIACAVTATLGAFVFGERPLEPGAPAATKLAPAASVAKAKPAVLPIRCWDRLESHAVPASAKWVRITGKICEGAVGLDGIVVTNQTTHSVATIFPLEDGLTTDLIALRDGSNELTFTIARPEGPVSGKLVLNR